MKGDLPLHISTTRRKDDLLAKENRRYLNKPDFRILHHGQPVALKLHHAATLPDILQYGTRRHSEAVSVFICFCSVASLVEEVRGEAAPGGTIQGAAKLILSMKKDCFYALNTLF
jgi:hypothetical protein